MLLASVTHEASSESLFLTKHDIKMIDDFSIRGKTAVFCLVIDRRGETDSQGKREVSLLVFPHSKVHTKVCSSHSLSLDVTFSFATRIH